MKRIFFTVVVLALLSQVVCLFSCQKDSVNINNLQKKPLSTIQKAVEGKWKVEGTFGGFTGWLPASGNEFVEINGNMMNGREFQWRKWKIESSRSFSTYAIQFIGFDEPSIYFSRLRNDSLYVGYVHILGFDAFTGQLWVRIK